MHKQHHMVSVMQECNLCISMTQERAHGNTKGSKCLSIPTLLANMIDDLELKVESFVGREAMKGRIGDGVGSK